MLSKEEILNMDSSFLSDSEKRYLLKTYYPELALPQWKEDLLGIKEALRNIRLEERLLRIEKESKRKRDEFDRKRWVLYTNNINAIKYGEFRVGHEELVRRALARNSRNPGSTVSDFTKWIYSLYQGPPDRISLQTGKDVEKQASFRIRALSNNAEWDLIYRDTLDENAEIKTISALKVDGNPIYGKPDAVFRHKITDEIVIVERKASNRDVPDNGWPNLKAQLWAYAHIDDWVDSPKIRLIGEVWGFDYFGLYLNRLLSWDMNDLEFCRENKELFDIYTGKKGELA